MPSLAGKILFFTNVNAFIEYVGDFKEFLNDKIHIGKDVQNGLSHLQLVGV